MVYLVKRMSLKYCSSLCMHETVNRTKFKTTYLPLLTFKLVIDRMCEGNFYFWLKRVILTRLLYHETYTCKNHGLPTIRESIKRNNVRTIYNKVLCFILPADGFEIKSRTYSVNGFFTIWTKFLKTLN